MTGTPIANKPEDAFPIMCLLGKWPQKLRWHLDGRYLIKRKMSYAPVPVIVGYKRSEEFSELLAQMSLRRLKSECLDLPQKLYNIEYIDMGGETKARYAAIKRESTADSPGQILAKIERLRQALHENPVEKLAWLEQHLADYPGPVVLVGHHRSLMSVLQSQGLADALIVGGTPDLDRRRIIQDFQAGKINSIGLSAAGSESITLTAASRLIFLEHDWRLTTYLQIQDRIHRIGQKEVCNITSCVYKRTIDQIIYNALQCKQDFAARLQGDFEFFREIKKEVN